MERPRLLWVRALNCCESKAARAIAEEYFSVSESQSVRLAPLWAQRVAARVVCWEFEDAQATSLRAMRDFKVAHPSMPLLMLTTQHSEALAVWAFRARVWNYLVKPVAASELRANFSTLAQIVADNCGPPRAVRSVRALLPNDVDSGRESPRVLSVRGAVEQVERHYAEKLRQATVAANCGMSSCRFSRAFKAAYGLTFSEFLIRFRINRACQLLRQGSHSATSAGLAVGFDDPSHFARAFRKLLAISPSLYQRQKLPLGPLFERRRRQGTNRTRASKSMSRRIPQGGTPLPQAHMPEQDKLGAQ